MRIPVFVSSPTKLNPAQEQVRLQVFSVLEEYGLEPRALGQSDYPTRLPLRGVVTIAKHCAGGVILGFEQQFAAEVEIRRGLSPPQDSLKNVSFPTPWNNLEGGILFSLDLPLLVFREAKISGGIFDNGVSDVFIHPMPSIAPVGGFLRDVRDVFLKWQADVRRNYYGET
ncbi:MAG TPA: hypothetical protein VGO11_21750 [Chthoniobacteraceae bacterium]|jgi:hypothetical protein|nr:hypothetical protein [Chthoniobacteraceae bacterium]